MRTLVIGDIHGALKAVKQVFERANIQPDDTLIFLGDYMDGWSDSYHTLTYLIELNQRQRCIFLRGNHDDLCCRWLQGKTLTQEWVQHGGQSTMDAYQREGFKNREAHLKFLNRLDNFYIDNQNRLFIHAGFQNIHGPLREYQPLPFYWDRTLWEMALGLDKTLPKTHPHYPKRLLLFDEIYIGHTPVTRIDKQTPTQMANVWNIDTGAAFKGPLTIMDIDTKEYWQSDEAWKLYPGEAGRNSG